MKKHILLASTLLISSLAMMAQSTLLVTNTSNSNSVITNSMVIYRTVAANGMDQLDINIKNTSTSTKNYKMRMYYNTVNVVTGNDSAHVYFCFGGTCYQPYTMISGTTETLTPNQDAATSTTVTPNPGTGHPISLHYDEASVAGIASIMYKIYDINNPSVDFMTFIVKYNDPTTSIKTNTSLLSYVSDVFPNPSNTKASITVNALSDSNINTVSILNTLGSVVSSKNIELFMGKNTISLDVESLSSGIYFAVLSSGNFKTVKKFTINK
jgi:hypothetical protein